MNSPGISVAEDSVGTSEINGDTILDRTLDYTPMTIHANISKTDDNIQRNDADAICIPGTGGYCDFIEDNFKFNVRTAGTIKFSTSAANSLADLDIVLYQPGAATFAGVSGGVTSNESITYTVTTPGIYILGVSYADNCVNNVNTSYTITVGQ
jgi:hypothetical protein